MATTVIAVAGPAGAGKTTWIRGQLRMLSEASGGAMPLCYLAPGVDEVPIDGSLLQLEFPNLRVLQAGEESLLFELPVDTITFMELGFFIDLIGAAPLLNTFSAKRIAVLPADSPQTEWHLWAEQVVVGRSASTSAVAQLWQAECSGQVFDPPSLAVFWNELIRGGYGSVQRAKGIFELLEGVPVYLDFVAELEPVEWTNAAAVAVVDEAIDQGDLACDPCINGRPDRFSGIQVIGEMLDRPGIVQTLTDCCLDDELLAQQQVQIQAQFQEQLQSQMKDD